MSIISCKVPSENIEEETIKIKFVMFSRKDALEKFDDNECMRRRKGRKEMLESKKIRRVRKESKKIWKDGRRERQ